MKRVLDVDGSAGHLCVDSGCLASLDPKHVVHIGFVHQLPLCVILRLDKTNKSRYLVKETVVVSNIHQTCPVLFWPSLCSSNRRRRDGTHSTNIGNIGCSRNLPKVSPSPVYLTVHRDVDVS